MSHVFLSFSVSIIPLSHTHKSYTELLINSTQTLPQSRASVYLSSILPLSSSVSLSLVWRHLWCDNLIRYHPEWRKERWGLENKGERKERIRGGGQGGQIVSHHSSSSTSVVLPPSVSPLPSSNFTLSSLQLPVMFSCKIPPPYCLWNGHFHLLLFSR